MTGRCYLSNHTKPLSVTRQQLLHMGAWRDAWLACQMQWRSLDTCSTTRLKLQGSSPGFTLHLHLYGCCDIHVIIKYIIIVINIIILSILSFHACILKSIPGSKLPNLTQTRKRLNFNRIVIYAKNQIYFILLHFGDKSPKFAE